MRSDLSLVTACEVVGLRNIWNENVFFSFSIWCGSKQRAQVDGNGEKEAHRFPHQGR